MNLCLFNPSMYVGQTVTQAISSANTKSAGMFIAPKAGNIRYIGTTFSALSGSPTVTLRAETVSSNLPSGTLWATNTSANYSPAGTSSFIWTQLTADAVVSAGDLIAAVVGYVSGTSATVRYDARTGDSNRDVIAPHAANMSAGSWALSGQYPMICVKYDDGTIIRGSVPANTVTASTFNSGSSPNERACRFTPPFNCTLTSVAFPTGTPPASLEFVVGVYVGTNTTPTATITVSAGDLKTDRSGLITLDFASPVSLTANQQYAISIRPTSAVNVTTRSLEFPSTAERDAVFGELTQDTRNGGAWIGESTTKTEQIFPIIGSVDAGGGGYSRSGRGTSR